MTTTLERRLAETRVADAERERRLASPGFGQLFTEHMVSARWDAERGWHDAAVVPYAPLELAPSTAVLHYAQTIFEGLKAYRQPDGSVATFRPDQNAARFQRSARRMAMPEVPTELFLGSLHALLEADHAWVPSGPEMTLYLRPFCFAVDPYLGVRPADTFQYLLIASPGGAYIMGGGDDAVSVWLSTEFVRAAPGGTGEAKTGGNYAASYLAQAQAAAQGCGQVVWLDALERRYVEEMGGMNLYFVEGGGDDAVLVTPHLTGTLLPGVTRDSILTVAGDLGLKAEERTVTWEQWRDACVSGAWTEAFACGTAAVVTPVGQVKHDGGAWTIGDGAAGPVAARVRRALVDVQWGRAPDPHGWRHPLVGPGGEPVGRDA